jgi:hypothetical protein
VLPLNDAALDAVKMMIARADQRGDTDQSHYLWYANQYHEVDSTQVAAKWDTAWRALRDAGACRPCDFMTSGTRSSPGCSQLASRTAS